MYNIARENIADYNVTSWNIVRRNVARRDINVASWNGSTHTVVVRMSPFMQGRLAPLKNAAKTECGHRMYFVTVNEGTTTMCTKGNMANIWNFPKFSTNVHSENDDRPRVAKCRHVVGTENIEHRNIDCTVPRTKSDETPCCLAMYLILCFAISSADCRRFKPLPNMKKHTFSAHGSVIVFMAHKLVNLAKVLFSTLIQFHQVQSLIVSPCKVAFH